MVGMYELAKVGKEIYRRKRFYCECARIGSKIVYLLQTSTEKLKQAFNAQFLMEKVRIN